VCLVGDDRLELPTLSV